MDDTEDIPAERVAGVDEVGRGPLAGDVVAAAVILDPENPVSGLRDSKKLSARRREGLAAEIRRCALAIGIGRASVAEIDELNILHASLLAMHRAVRALTSPPGLVLVDGNRLPRWEFRAEAVVGGTTPCRPLRPHRLSPRCSATPSSSHSTVATRATVSLRTRVIPPVRTSQLWPRWESPLHIGAASRR